MNVETKLGLSTAGLVAAMICIAVTANLRIQRAIQLSEKNTKGRMPLLSDIRESANHAGRSVRALESFMLLSRKPDYAADRLYEIAEAERSLTLVEARGKNLGIPEDSETMKQIATGMRQLRQEEEHVAQLAESRAPADAEEAARSFEQELLPLYESMSAAILRLGEAQTALAQSEVLEMDRQNRLTVKWLWLATILSALGAAVARSLLARHLVGMLRVLVTRANSIAAGDLTGSELHLGSKDQIAALAGAMNRMQAALGGIIGTVADTAGSLSGSAVSMRSASDQIHRRIDQQSQQTRHAATAMQEMSASIAEVSRHAQSAAEAARGAADTAREGGLIVKEMLAAMHSIAAGVSETSSTIGLLGEDSKRISQIVTVIDEIARKTNLLALNAAIEAARAGDQGRGFAVVAGEVRRLAESTAQATGEIAAMIQEIQDRTRNAIDGMAAGTGTVQQGVVTTTQAGEALERIIGMAERVDRMIAQIAIAASQQAAAADQSSASLDSIHALSHENLTEIATTAAGIENLRGTAVALEKQVDRFQVQAMRPRLAA
jgi:methyl-accepting chemotaxis protein